MKTLTTILKWITVIVLLSSAVFFFMPYDGDLTVLDIYKMASALNATSVVTAVLLPLIIPAALSFISGIIMMFKISIPKTVVVVIFNAISAFLYNAYISGQYDAAIGLTANFIVALAGIILPIIIVILSKVAGKPSKSE